MFLKVGNDMASGNNDQKGGAAGDSANDQGQEDIWASVVQRKVKRVRILFFFFGLLEAQPGSLRCCCLCCKQVPYCTLHQC